MFPSLTLMCDAFSHVWDWTIISEMNCQDSQHAMTVACYMSLKCSIGLRSINEMFHIYMKCCRNASNFKLSNISIIMGQHNVTLENYWWCMIKSRKILFLIPAFNKISINVIFSILSSFKVLQKNYFFGNEQRRQANLTGECLIQLNPQLNKKKVTVLCYGILSPYGTLFPCNSDKSSLLTKLNWLIIQ